MNDVARIPRPEREDDAEVTLAFDDNRRASLLFGQYDQNLAKLERRLRVSCVASGNHVTLKGATDACEHGRRALETLYARAQLGLEISPGDVDGAIEETARQKSLFPDEIGRAHV
jgi:phosphate starvation-inducible PhoH-like protein